MKYLLLIILLLLVILFISYKNYNLFVTLYLLIFLFVSIIPFCKKLIEKKFDLFEISFIFFIGFLFTYFIGTISMIIYFNTKFYINNETKLIINKMIFLYIISIIFYYFGYNIKLNYNKIVKLLFKLPSNINKRKLFFISLIFYILGVMSFLIIIFKFISLSDLIKYSYQRALLFQNLNYIYAIVQFSITSYIILFMLWLKNEFNYKYSRYLLIMFLLIIIFINFVLGGRYRTISIFIMVICVYYYVKKNINFKILFLSFLLILFLFVLITIVRYYNGINLVKNYIKEIILTNLYYPYYFYKILTEVPDKLTFQYGKTFLSFIFYPLPRSLFPQKPLSAGALITSYLFPKLKYSSIPPTILGEFYLNFSYLGIIMGMFLTGIVHKIIYIYFYVNKEDFLYIVFYAILIPFVFWSNFLDFTLTLVYFFILLIPFLLISIFSKKLDNEKS